MSSKNKWRPRITFDVSEETYNRQQRLMPWGVRENLMNTVFSQLLDSIEQHGEVVIYLIINGKMTLFGKQTRQTAAVLGTED